MADEFARLLRQHPHRSVGAVLRVGRLGVVFVLCLVRDDEAFFQDDIEARLDVIVVEFVVVVFDLGERLFDNGGGRWLDVGFLLDDRDLFEPVLVRFDEVLSDKVVDLQPVFFEDLLVFWFFEWFLEFFYRGGVKSTSPPTLLVITSSIPCANFPPSSLTATPSVRGVWARSLYGTSRAYNRFARGQIPALSGTGAAVAPRSGGPGSLWRRLPRPPEHGSPRRRVTLSTQLPGPLSCATAPQ